MKKILMEKARAILRFFHGFGFSRTTCAEQVNVSRSTVREVLKRAEKAEIGWPLPEGMDDETLRALLYPPTRTKLDRYYQPDWEAIEADYYRVLKPRETPMTRQAVWERYCEEAECAGKQPYGRSRFYELMSAALPERPKVRMRFRYEPGQWAFVDFSGKTVLVRDHHEERPVEIFVGILPSSGLIFATAVPDQKLQSWLIANRAMFEYFGGCPANLGFDNLKSAVTKWHDGDPVLNRTYADFMLHYDVAGIACRAGKPRDKGAVEKGVSIVQRRILLPLRDGSFFGLADLNREIRRGLDKLNNTPMERTGMSRCAAFAENELEALQPLPATRWEWVDWKTRKVHPDGHVSVNRNFYSVPGRYVGKTLTVAIGERILKMYASVNGSSIATHLLVEGRGQYCTNEDHLSYSHRMFSGMRLGSYGEHLLERMGKIGPAAKAWAVQAYASRDFEQQAYRAVLGVAGLKKTYGSLKVERACKIAKSERRYSAGYIRHLLKVEARQEKRSGPEPIRPHKNIRGSSYYDEEEGKE